MQRLAMLLVAVCFLTAAKAAEGDSDARITETLLSEIRQLRLDLQAAAATIQRVQIAMYRVQSETPLLERASQQLENVRARCTELREQRQSWMLQAKASPDPESLKATAAQVAEEEQQCQSEQVNAETQLRTEQTKMDEFQEQLSRLDATLAANGPK